ncbi:MAG: alpha/beta hydrolase, partial [Proteobacteria bacterium]|nr:alpha/beta hydrolase [Pseudomonadota bacterium]
MPSEPQAPPPLPPFTPQPVAAAPTAESVFIAAQDGLRLHVREHGRRTGGGLPIVCLPGLSRTCEDFDVLASALAADAYSPRRVLAIDYRGRGRSGYDNPDRYTPTVELGDLITILTALEVAPAMFIGTSRGGILTMLLAAARPTAIAGAVLNDIGPVIELKGLMRIKSYVGRLPQPRSIEEGADILRRLFDAQFPDQPPPVWIAAARRA